MEHLAPYQAPLLCTSYHTFTDRYEKHENENNVANLMMIAQQKICNTTHLSLWTSAVSRLQANLSQKPGTSNTGYEAEFVGK